MKKTLIYSLELLVAAILLWFDQRVFFLYLFIVIIWALDSKLDYLRKLIRVFQVVNDARYRALAEHLSIPKGKADEVLSQYLKELPDDQRASLQKDINDVTS